MACDSLIGAEVVVPSGADGAKVIKVDLKNHPDLLWALRGAGNGNFGIVTSLTYKVAPLKERRLSAGDLGRPRGPARVFDTWQRTAPYADNRLGTQLEIHKTRDPAVRGSRGRDGGRGQEAAGPDPVDRQARRSR